MKLTLNLTSLIRLGGRPQKPFSELADCSKRRRTENLRASVEEKALTFAASMACREQGNEPAAKLIRLVDENPAAAEEIMDSWRKRDESGPQPYSPEEALAFMISNDLTKKQYKAILKSTKSRNCNIYPSYHKILAAKNAAYPPDLVIHEKLCEVPLQSMLHHFSHRLFTALNLPEEYLHNNGQIMDCELICKYGCDGSSGHSNYKQKWTEENLQDSSMFLTAIVPLRLVIDGSAKILWENPRPSSTFFALPLKMQWTTETSDLIRDEENYVKNQLVNLEKFIGFNCRIKFTLLMTMIDGKVRFRSQTYYLIILRTYP